ncbi:MAG: 16S rRNA (cytidine(1402)-2'-O)-methyltransferase [Pseudomonadota bacterium]
MSGSFQIGDHRHTAPPLEPGLYIVATPIGNLRDITLRALETIAACDLLACEDTRMTRRLLDRYAIAQKPIAYHEHNADKAGATLLKALEEGQSVAIVSDAGTPLLSDPGYRIVVDARAAGLRVIPLPGPSALTAALSASGVPTDNFRFCGFLPAKEKARNDALNALSNEACTLIFYEAPGRLTKTLNAISAIYGADRPVVVARELTKQFETILADKAGDMTSHFAAGTVKGEIVVLVAPGAQAPLDWDGAQVDALLEELITEMPAAKAAKVAAAQTGWSRADLYDRLLALKSDGQ